MLFTSGVSMSGFFKGLPLHEIKTTDEQEEMNGALWDVDVVEES